ncbi:cytochrome P450 6k1-like [Microplitis mediator]|uniref:cytochrome P450 6k1-like n=1 Tax=Microplitis mediator TaxID=375433 RepID=UPI002553A662|nr:cytochrome P450 6k1-like [Microplitis mediator]
MGVSVEILLAIVAVIVLLYYYFASAYNFWSSRGIKGPKPSPPLGNIAEILMGKHNPGTYLQMLYNEYPDEPIVGIYRVREPIACINDLDLIKDVLIKDFSKFVDRGTEMYENHEPLSINIFNLEPKRWRMLRTKLSPIFTSGKLRDMFHLIVNCSESMGKYLEKHDNEVIDIRELSAKFATDVIGVYAFGLKANALEDENSLFRQIGRHMFEVKWTTAGRNLLGTFLPTIYRMIGYIMRDDKTHDFLINVTKETLEYRQKNNIVRNDFIDLLLGIKNQGKMIDDVEITDNLLAAQLLIFFVGGFETTSSTMSHTLYELAINQHCQDRLRQEITEQLEKTNGQITYDSIKEMKYLNQVYHESLRKHPALMMFTRRCTEPYTFARTNVSVPANTKVWIPLYAIQWDPKYWPNPEVFDPERFSEENIKNRHPMAFLALGDGPRNCIGARFGAYQVKVGITKLLSEYKVEVCEKTDLTHELNRRGFLLVPKNGIHLRVKKI